MEYAIFLSEIMCCKRPGKLDPEVVVNVFWTSFDSQIAKLLKIVTVDFTRSHWTFLTLL